jgi:hypothetical protein
VPLAGSGVGGAAAGSAGTARAAGSAAAAGGSGQASAGTSGAAAPTTGDCDRACLLQFMQGYLDALVAKDPAKLKVSATVKFTDNGVVAKLGDGLWKTATKLVPDLRLDFADPVEGQVATHVVVDEGAATGVIYQARLKIVKQEITEIETMTVRRSGAANGFFNTANMKPEPAFLVAVEPAKRMSRADLKAITELYLDYLEGSKSGSQVPFDTNCKRYENGQATATGLSSFMTQSWSFAVTRRILIIDEEAQITWGMFPFQQSASALVVGEAFKIVGGKITMIQAVMANMPTKAWD